jgi:Uncharacterised nucleotidyltransferase
MNSDHMHSEMHLLIACARTQISDSIAQRIQALCQVDLDWQVLVQLANQHRLLPLLYNSLSKVCPDRVPPDIFQYLQDSYRQNGFRNLRFTGELLQILNYLKTQGFEAVPFKGPVLAIVAYGDLNLRAFCDLDILVRTKDFIPVRNSVMTQGYGPSRASWHFSQEEEDAHQTWLGECSLTHPGRSVSIDVHQRLVAGYLFRLSRNFDDVWMGLESIAILDKPVLSFKSEDLLLYLCIHGTKDFWQRISWICDIAELVDRHPTLQWRYVLDQARVHRVGRMLRVGLSLAQQVLGTRLPPEIEAYIASDRALSQIVPSLLQGLYQNTNIPPAGISLGEFWYYLQMLDDWSERLHLSRIYLLYWIFISCRDGIRPNAKDRRFCRLPVLFHWLYYLVRPIRLMKEYWITPLLRKTYTP